jgi:polyisoprenoid-binding protein YceI
MQRLFLLLLLLSLPLASLHAAENTAAYYIPPAQFNVELEVMDDGFANMYALLRNATGSFSFDDTSKTLSRLKFAVDTTSLIASNNDNQRNLANMLSAFQYSEIRITAPDNVVFTDNKADIKATVSLHGQSKPVTFEATLNRTGTTPHSGSMWSSEGEAVGLSLKGTIKRADFGMVDDPAAPAHFGDTITLKLDVQAIKQ